MAHRIVSLLYAVILCLGVTACEKLGPDEARLEGIRRLNAEMLKTLDGIPAEYGNLIAVTTSGQAPKWAQIWFEKPDKTIVVVSVNTMDGFFWKEALMIPRK